MDVQGAEQYVNIRKVLTKNLLMFIMHRITIQRIVGYASGPVLFGLSSLRNGQTYPSNSVLVRG